MEISNLLWEDIFMHRLKFTAEKKIEIIEAFKAGKVTYSQLKQIYGMDNVIKASKSVSAKKMLTSNF